MVGSTLGWPALRQGRADHRCGHAPRDSACCNISGDCKPLPLFSLVTLPTRSTSPCRPGTVMTHLLCLALPVQCRAYRIDALTATSPPAHDRYSHAPGCRQVHAQRASNKSRYAPAIVTDVQPPPHATAPALLEGAVYHRDVAGLVDGGSAHQQILRAAVHTEDGVRGFRDPHRLAERRAGAGRSGVIHGDACAAATGWFAQRFGVDNNRAISKPR